MFEGLFGEPKIKEETPLKEGMFEGLFEKPKPLGLDFKDFPKAITEAGWQGWEKRGGKMTSALQKLKDVGSAPPVEYRELTQQEKITLGLGLPITKLEKAEGPPLEAPTLEERLEATLPIPKIDLIGGLKTFAKGLAKLPMQVDVAILKAMQGAEGASVAQKDWVDYYAQMAHEDINKFAQETAKLYKGKVAGIPGTSLPTIPMEELAMLPQNLAYSITSMGGGLAVGGPIALVPGPGFRVLAFGMGTAASGKIAYEMTTYEIMQEYLEIKNEEMNQNEGRNISIEEEKKLKEDFNSLAVKYGLWEAIPEAVSNLAFTSILTSPMTKMFGKEIAGRIVGKVVGLYGEEMLTETITEMGQVGVRGEAGLPGGREINWADPREWVAALKEIAPQTFLLTTTMAGAGATIVGTKKIVDTLKEELGEEHPLYNKFKAKLEVSPLPVVPLKAKPTFEGLFEVPTKEVKAEVPTVEVKPEIPKKEVKPIPKELEPLAVEARKYKSVEEIPFEKDITDLSTFKSPNKKAIRYSYTEGNIQLIVNYDPNTRRYYPVGRNMETGKQIPFFDNKNNGYATLKEAKSQLTDFYNQAKAITPEVKPVVKPKAKLPEIKKVLIEKGKLYGVLLMPDPGLDKFIAEEVRPVLNKAAEAGKYLWKQTKHIPEFMMRIIEPAKLVKGVPYATVIRGIHKPEARLVEFDQKRLETMDTNLSELEKWFDKFSDKDLANLMRTRGKTNSSEARRIQVKAFAEISKELKVPNVKKAIQEIADFNYKFLQEVAGKDIRKVEDYFYGMYKDPKMVDKFLDYWRSTERFMKKKVFPTVADAEAYGLELKHNNPVANLRAEFRAIAKLEGMNWMKEELMRTGEGIYIAKTDKAPIKWEKVNDPVFRDLRVEPNLARLINNLISTNKITRIPVLNTIRKINNVLRTYKFIGSAFHLISVGKQSAVDSGYLGFAYKKTATKGATFGFKEYDPIFKTPEYKEYIELGGGHKYSVEFEAKRVLVDFVDKVNRGNFLGAFTKIGIFPAKIPTGFVNWMFNKYIPKVKYAKYLDFVAKKEKGLDRMTTDKEKIEIIKEGQNFYGMMNERLFGRSGTTTTALRFVFLAPGYAEGNYRTIIKSFSQWGVKGTYGAGRSRFNIVNSLILTSILATVGTLIFTKKWPEKPEKLEDIRDLFKIDTGYVDDKGRKVMIDLMTYDKDYWNVYFNVLRGRPDKAITESITRVGGMKAPTAEMLWDFSGMLMGNKIYDWKGNEVIELTDPFLIKLQKLAIHEIKRLEPISMSVYKQLRNKEVDMALALVAMVMGVRPTKTEEDKRIQKITSKIYSLKGQQEELYQYLGSIDNPREAIEKYNKMVNDVLDSKMVPQEMRDEWKPKLLIEMDRLLSNKVYQLTDPMTKLTDAEKEIAKIKKYLNNFEVSMEEAEEWLKHYWKEHPVKDKWSKTHRKNIKNRKARLKDRYQ